MKKLKLFFVFAVLLLASQSAFALTCAQSRNSQGASDDCWVSVVVASNETTLVSQGTVLVFDIANAQFSADKGAFQVRVPTASANGVFVAGVAQNSITSGSGALILARGKGYVALKTTETVTSGNALFVSTSGDASVVTSTTQTQLGFALETSAASGNSRALKKAYITVV